MRPANSYLDGQRHEVKLILPITYLHRVAVWLRTHDLHFSPLFTPRWVNSIYFDTEEFASFHEAVEGDSRRMKVRLRWYGSAECFEESVLELKCKIGSLGWKRGTPIAERIDLVNDTWREIVKRIRFALPVQQRLVFEQAPRPAMINRYYRSYFLSADRSVRITVDDRMAFWPQCLGRRPNLRRTRRFHCHAVIEFKAQHDKAAVLSDAVRSLQGRISKHSKYVVGSTGLPH